MAPCPVVRKTGPLRFLAGSAEGFEAGYGTEVLLDASDSSPCGDCPVR